MRLFLSAIGITAALVMAGVSASMNYVFLASLGKTQIDGQILGAASAAADVLKALLPFFIAWAWRCRRVVAVLCGAGLFVLFASFSLLSAIGFAADNRGVMTLGRAAIDQSFARIQEERDQVHSHLSSLPPHRPQTVVAEELRAAEQSRLWPRSKLCTEATETASRAFCAGYFQLRAELAAAEAAQSLRAKIETLQGELDGLKAQGAGQERDPQVAILAKLFSLSQDRVQLMLIIAVALVVEFGSSLGLFLASGHGAAKQIPVSEPADAGQLPQPEAAPRMVGDIEDFVLQALVPMPGTSLSLAELQSAYASWCEGSDFEALRAETFAERFAALAQAIGMPSGKAGYSGIGLQTQQLAAA